MAAQRFRTAADGDIDRNKTIRFSFDGKIYEGCDGDTLASALMANGVRVLGRSFKYHRPRGLFAMGPEEPNALVTVRQGARREPNIPATMVEIFDGLVAESQNHWPSLGFDLTRVNDFLSSVLVSGFYYKTFMWPASFWEPVYERLIRKAAGMGVAPDQPDPDRYEHANAFCDVLVVGGGPAGRAAARKAGEAGERVLLVEQMPRLGASDDEAAALAALDNVTVMTRTTAFGQYDDNCFALAERVSDHLPTPPEGQPRQRRWVARAERVIFATGAIERPLVFRNNDLPGVMLASAAQGYAKRFGVLPGRAAVVATNNDSAYRAALDLAASGVNLLALVDAREKPPANLAADVLAAGIEVITGSVTMRAVGWKGVRAVEIATLSGDGKSVSAPGRRIKCDLLAVSGGWSPVVHLMSHKGGRPTYDENRQAFVPGDLLGPNQEAVGGCTGDWTDDVPARELWKVPQPEGGSGKAFIDFQHDVTTKDVELAHREGYVSVEHLKRYTMLGRATDQGKTANIAGLALIAEARGLPIPAVGTTTFRPPYTPTALGTVAGGEVGRNFVPERFSPIQDWHAHHGAVMVEVGLWMRPRYYPKDGEDIHAAYRREADTVRKGVGIVDVTSLGKIDVQGPDAAEFLDRVYANTFSTLKVGRARYGAMLRDDGIVFDDGTTSRLSENHYFMTTTTANAGTVMAHMEMLLQTAWQELRVHLTSVSDQWAGIAVAGPKSRELLSALGTDIDMSDEAFPFMGVREGTLENAPVRIFRISFSGELAYEIYTTSDFGDALWHRIWGVGQAFGVVPYGTEAMAALRIEKGHVAGPELDGLTTMDDLGLGKMASTKKHYVGSVLKERPALLEEVRLKLVGLIPVDRSLNLRSGALVREEPFEPKSRPVRDVHSFDKLTERPETAGNLGYITSVSYSPELGHYVGLALVSNGRSRLGDRMYACHTVKGENIEVEVVSPHFVDPDGKRLRV
ncbi:MAG: 2Fe-2S iron-sulfur cluster-binding protein [Pseudomonadota bacterium]|nr:2Fe-2S iron-sulfur cluster-binding protein [Pseudomonadota bacterium]